MKLLYLVHEFYPHWHLGTEKFVLQLAQQSQAAGHEVTIVTYDLPAPDKTVRSSVVRQLKRRIKQTLGLQRIHWRGLYRHYLAKATAPAPVAIPQRCYTYQGLPVIAFQAGPTQQADLAAFAAELLTRLEPDLIHAAHTMRTAPFLQVALARRLPYLLTLTDYWLICPRCQLHNEQGQLCHGPRGGDECRRACPSYDPAVIGARLAHARHLLTNAAAIVAPSHFLASKIQAEVGALPFTIIPYGMATTHFRRNERTCPTTAPLVFFFAGFLTASKGVSLLVAAFQRLPNPALRLLVYGNGPLATTLRRQTAHDPRIQLAGVYTPDQLSDILQQVDVVVVPSLWHENMPLIMQEAQACGVPTLVSDVGGMTECVTDGVNGFTFRVGDVADLQRKMQMIIDQPEILNGIKANMRNPKPGQYRVTSLAEEGALYLQEYEKILAASSAAVQPIHEVQSWLPARSGSRPNDSEYCVRES